MSVSHRGVRYTVPDTVSVKVKQRVKGLPRILQEIRALTAHLPGIDAFRDAADMAYRERPETPSTVCSSGLEPGTRLVLSAWVSTGFHGSTALSVPASPYEIIRKSCSA